MKQKRTMILAVVLVLALAGISFAQSSTTLGISYWRATPDLKLGFGDDAEMSAANFYGPYGSIRMDKLSIGASYLMGKFNLTNGSGDEKMEAALKRNDLNLQLGYSITPAVTIFGALKNIKGKLGDWTYGGESIGDYMDVKAEYSGTLVGGGLSAVMAFPDSKAFLFGSAAYLTGKIKWDIEVTADYSYYKAMADDDDNADDEKTNIITITAGAGYRLSPQLALLVGYRIDNMGSGDDTDNYEKYKGVTASLGYTF
jgi:predicted porin